MRKLEIEFENNIFTIKWKRKYQEMETFHDVGLGSVKAISTRFIDICKSALDDETRKAKYRVYVRYHDDIDKWCCWQSNDFNTASETANSLIRRSKTKEIEIRDFEDKIRFYYWRPEENNNE